MNSNNRYFKGWAKPGPMIESPTELDEGESLDALSGDFKIYQYKNGHRFSTDDLLVAWYALTKCSRVESILDLGSGLGTIAMICAWKLPGVKVTSLEAQERSYLLALKSRKYNLLQNQWSIFLGDMREDQQLSEALKFDCITGSPPYFDISEGILPDHPQKLECRFEIRGGVEVYLQKASKHLSYGAQLFLVIPDTLTDRVVRSAPQFGLFILQSRAVIFKEGEKPLLRLFGLGLQEHFPDKMKQRLGSLGIEENPLVIRNINGEVTEEYLSAKISIGFPP